MSTIELHGRFRAGTIFLAVVAAFGFGAIVRLAGADHYHSNCVGHGFVHGSSTTDGSFFSRVEAGCGSTYRRCAIYSNGSFRGDEVASNSTTTCNAWSSSFGNYVECLSHAEVYNAGVFSTHDHRAHNWCG